MELAEGLSSPAWGPEVRKGVKVPQSGSELMLEASPPLPTKLCRRAQQAPGLRSSPHIRTHVSCNVTGRAGSPSHRSWPRGQGSAALELGPGCGP